MFKKAQLKVFAIITGILVLLFISVLGSINLIMRSITERQSKKILGQIAEGVEYDEKTMSFVFMRPDDLDKKHDFHYDVKPAKPVTTTSMTEADVTEAATTTSATTTEAQTTAVQNTTAAVQQTSALTTSSAAVTTSAPASTTAYIRTTASAPPFHPPVTSEEQNPLYPPYDPWHGKFPQFPDNGGFPQPSENGNDFPNYWDYWNFWNNWNNWNNQQDGGAPQQTTDREKASLTLAEELYGLPTLLGDSAPVDNSPPPEQPHGKGEPVPKAIGSIDFFVVMADRSGNYLSVLNNNELERDTAQNYIDTILKKDSASGMLSSLQFYKLEKSNGTLIVFTDKSAEMDMLNKLLRTTIIIGIASVLLLSAAAFFLSRKIMEPLKIAFNKQKQFISDASHELKTPLTVISANADVLSGEIGENKWLTYIRSQADRMNVLVNDLLNLTRLENNSSDFVRTDFDLSRAVINTALPFECRAFETNKKFELNVDNNITVNGSERHIKQMTAVFIDNALKYSDSGGTVRISLKAAGDKKILSVYNTGSGINDDEKEKIFERFYRSDESRNRATGGYGLGLAIAKSIIDKHKFKIQVETTPGKSICFIVTM